VILLPFQLVVLGLDGPAVSATTLLYSVIAMPAGIWRYRRAGRLSYPLTHLDRDDCCPVGSG